MTEARALHIQMEFLADTVRCFVRERSKPNTGERRTVFFFWHEFCQTVVINQAEVHALHKSKLFRHSFSFEQLVLVSSFADGLYKRAVDVLVKDLAANFHSTEKYSTVSAV